MMESIVFRLLTLDGKSSPPARHIIRPTWLDINNSITDVFEYGGFVILRIDFPEAAFNWSLEMRSLPKKFRLITLTRDSDPKKRIFEWWEPEDLGFRGAERFGDDEWDARTVCEDINVAQSLFKDMFDHGGLSALGFRQMRSSWNPKPN